jgi:uncharacterized membrane protein
MLSRASRLAILALSFITLFTVMTGYFQSPQTDEGSAAHIFQIAILLLVPALLLFLATADWRRPWRSARPLALPLSTLVVAFAALYYLEHRY